MKERITKLLHEHALSLEQKRKQIENFAEDPLSLFTDLSEDAFIVFDSLERMDDKFWQDYQAWQYPLVVKALQDTFTIRPFEINWLENVYPSPIYFLHEGYPVCALHPYDRRFVVLPPENLMGALEQYKELKFQAIELWEQYKTERIHMLNPFLEASDSLTSNFKVVFNQRKREKEHQERLNELDKEYSVIEERIRQLELKIESISRADNELHYEIETLFKRLRTPLHLSFHNELDDLMFRMEQDIRQVEQAAESRITTLEKRSIDEDAK